jgi:ribokinase
VTLVTVVGRDRFGDAALELLAGERIETRWVQRVARPTDVGFVMLGPDGIPAITTCADLNQHFDAGVVADAAEAFADCAVVVCQLEAPDDVALAAFRLAREQGAMTILNPAPARQLPRAVVELTDVLVPNEHEARSLLGSDLPAESLAHALRKSFPIPTVVVTGGARGAWVASQGGTTHHAAPAVVASDTTGAGDAFVGALAASLSRGASLARSITFAVDVSSRAVTRPGTIPSFPRLADLSMPTASSTILSQGVTHDRPRSPS